MKHAVPAVRNYKSLCAGVADASSLHSCPDQRPVMCSPAAFPGASACTGCIMRLCNDS